jgi:ribonuclease HI
LWDVGLTAIVTAVNNAVADVHPTPQRTAARSSIAAAMSRWGCRADPNRWDWTHLTDAIEARLRHDECRDVGDAWMLATALLEKEHRAEYREREELSLVSMWEIKGGGDFAEQCRRRDGRWRGRIEEGDPLRPDAPHFARERSSLISEPAGQGGLALAAEPLLMRAGVVAIEHMGRRTRQEGLYEWQDDYEAARRANPRLPRNEAGATAWKRQLERLRAAGVRSVGWGPTQARDGGPGGELPTIMQTAQHGVQRAAGRRTNATAATKVRQALDMADVREARSQRAWTIMLRRMVGQVARRPAREWSLGNRDSDLEARGARLVFVSGDDGEERSEAGGEARWMRRHELDYVPAGSDALVAEEGAEQGVERLDRDGHCTSWREREAQMLKAVDFDEEGWMVKARSRERFTEEEIARLPAALRMLGNACIQLTRAKAEVIDDRLRAKRKGLHINLATARADKRTFCRVQAQFNIDTFYAADGSRQVVGEGKDKEWVNARACVRDDGDTCGGRMMEEEGADNYFDELAAQLDAVEQHPAGGRIAIVFDATSPIEAMKAFRKASARRRQGYLAREWLDTLLQLTAKHEVVVFIWRRSHTGSPANEWADAIVDNYAEAGGIRAVPRRPVRFAAVQHTMCRRGVRSWAQRTAARVIARRLGEACVESIVREDGDVHTGDKLADDVYATVTAILSQRSCMGDEKRARGMRGRDATRIVCPFGCSGARGTPAAFTWLHAQYRCKQPELVEARGDWLKTLTDVEKAMAEVNGWDQRPEYLRSGQIGTALAAAWTGEEGDSSMSEAQVQARSEQLCRVAGGLFQTSGDPKLDRRKELRTAVEKATISGARVQQKAVMLTTEIESELVAELSAARSVRKLAMRWRACVTEGGPRRAAALREIHQTAACVRTMAKAAKTAGRLSEEREQDGIAEIQRRSASAIRTARMLYPRVGARAYFQWWLLARLQNWRARAMVDWRRRRDRLRTKGTAGAKQRRSPRWAADAESSRWAHEVIGAAAIPATATRAKLRAGLHSEVASGHGRIVGVIECEGLADWHWRNGGGWKAERRRRAALDLARRRKAAVRAAEAFVHFFQQPTGARLGLSGFKRQPTGATVNIEVAPRRRRRARKRRRTAVGSAAEGGVASRRKSKTRETDAWRQGGWEAGEDYEVDEIIDRRGANAEDVINYADVEGANVYIGSAMYLVAWKGWDEQYYSWEPYDFIIDNELIDTFERKRAQGGAQNTWMSKPDEVVGVRYARLHSRGKPRLEARCRWHTQRAVAADEESPSREEWVHATRKVLGSRAFATAKELERTLARQQAGAAPAAATSSLRVTTRAERTRGRRRDDEAEEEAGKINPPRRRRLLAIIDEDDEMEVDDGDGDDGDREGGPEGWMPGCCVA